MMSRIRWTEIICLAAVTTAIVCFVTLGRRPEGETVRREVGRDGDLVVVGRGVSPLASKYRAASDLLADGKISEAEAIYKELIEAEPTSPNPYVGLAVCYMKRGDGAGALQLYEKAFEMDPKSAYVLVGMGSACVSMSDYEKAIEKYAAALVLDETAPDAHWGLVISCAHLGKKARARGHLDRFKKLVPDSRHIESLEAVVEGAGTQPASLPDTKGDGENDGD